MKIISVSIACILLFFGDKVHTKRITKPLVSNKQQFAKYSYIIGSLSLKNELFSGTCFFIRQKDRLYFVTAGHNVSEWDTFNNVSYESQSDTSYIRLFIKEDTGNRPFWIPFPSKRAKTSLKKGYFFQTPDIYVADITEPAGLEINSIEQYIPSKWPLNNPDEVFFWGYPNYAFPNQQAINTIHPTLDSGVIIRDISKRWTWNVRRIRQIVEDSLNYEMVEDILFGSHKNTQGTSGSPVFWRYGTSYVFGGVCIGVDSINHRVYIVRPQEVTKAILSISSRD